MFLKSITYHSKKYKGIQKLSDEELILRYTQDSDNRVIEILFDRYAHLAYASCLKYLQNIKDAEDLTMIIFESLGEKLRKYKIDNFKSWIFVSVRNACFMKLRKAKKIEMVNYLENSPNYCVENEALSHLDNEKELMLEHLSGCLNDLKEEQRICVDLMYLKKKNYREISELTGFDIKKVKSHIQNGKRKLRIMLEGNEK